jgi:hypothetical protein
MEAIVVYPRKPIPMILVLISTLAACAIPEAPQPPPIGLENLTITSYTGQQSLRHWQAKQAKLYTNAMELSQTHFSESRGTLLTADSLRVPLYRGEWSGSRVFIEIESLQEPSSEESADNTSPTASQKMTLYGDLFLYDEMSGILQLKENVRFSEGNLRLKASELSYDSRADESTFTEAEGVLS